MSTQVIFLTGFLGLVAGRQSVAIQVSGAAQAVRILLGDRQVALIEPPSWRTDVDFGTDLTPRELTAVAIDRNGNEIARTSQILNLPKPEAEFDIIVSGDRVALRWRHLTGAPPVRTVLTLDGRPLVLDASLGAALPAVDPAIPHVLAAELHFANGFVSRRELVIQGFRSDTVSTQLTPVAIRDVTSAEPKSGDGCLSDPKSKGSAVRISALETPRASVTFVRDPNAPDVAAFLARLPASRRSSSGTMRSTPDLTSVAFHSDVRLDRETFASMLWPVAEQFRNGQNPSSILFEPSVGLEASRFGLLFLLTSTYNGKAANAPRQFADAVAVAGSRAITGAQRRAVVLVIGSARDSSEYRPVDVRRYLASIGVPLYVWSFSGPRPDAVGTWGEVEDVSTMAKFTAAVNRLRRALAEQRIAWVNVDPLTALRLEAKERCGIEAMARATP
jgi:hypothetical protein